VTGTTVNPFRWVGRVGYYWDDGTGTFYIRARVYEPVTGRWMSQDPLCYPVVNPMRALRNLQEGGNADSGNASRPSFSSNTSYPSGYDSGIWNLYAYAGENPVNRIDPTGNDCPGCDVPAWAFGNQLNNSPCVLACCAQHDKCYYDKGCTAESWFHWWGTQGTRQCARCNYDVVCCIAKCARGNHMAGKPLYFCAGGPNAGRFITIGEPCPPNDYADLDEAKEACCT
jgi:RHS repeat-associated protein